MPSTEKFVVNLRGTERYARFLDELAEALRADDVPLSGRSALVEYLIAQEADRLGIEAPPRIRPVGSNRFGGPGESAR